MSVRSAGLVKQLCRTIAAVEQGSEGTFQMGLLHHANIAELYSLYHYFTLTENLNKKGRGKIYRVPDAHTPLLSISFCYSRSCGALMFVRL